MNFKIVFSEGHGYGSGASNARTPFHELMYKVKKELANPEKYDEFLFSAALMIRERLAARFQQGKNPDGTSWVSLAAWRRKRPGNRILIRTGLMSENIVLSNIKKLSISITNQARSNGILEGHDYPSKLKKYHPEWNWWQASGKDIDDAAELMRSNMRDIIDKRL